MATKQVTTCILCGSVAEFFGFTRDRRYYQCPNCCSVMMDPNHYVTPLEEKARYETHNNDVDDPGYQKFVSPVVDQIIHHHTSTEKGLDFGSGTGPVITKLLRDQGFNIRTYDPFFDADLSALETTYHYIACCEVVEHFQEPAREFKKLRNLLKQGGSLYCMTSLYNPGIDFDSWNYKDDETHVIFYHREALEWIRQDAGFTRLEIHDNRLFTLEA